MPSRRSSLSLDSSDPPPYSAAGTTPPSFRSSPPASQFGGEDDSIQEFPTVYTSPRTYGDKVKPRSSKLSKPRPLKPITEKIEPPYLAADEIESAQNSRPQSKLFTLICCNCPVICVNKRFPCWAVTLVVACFLIMAVVLGTVIPLVVKSHGDESPSNSSIVVTATVTSTVRSTIIQTLTATTSPTSTTAQQETLKPDQYLGGFDAVTLDSSYTTHMFYTDQHSGLQHIFVYYSWERANPSSIANDVHPGSPITASNISDQIHVFYVDNDNYIQGLYGRPTTSSSYMATWLPHSIGSLQLKTADSLFIRTCVAADSQNYTYASYMSMYLYYAIPGGGIKKYGFSNDTSQWQQMDDIPDLSGVREVECQLTAGVETLWTTNNQSHITSWYRAIATNWQWKRGYTGPEVTADSTNILSISTAETKRTHIIFQNANDDLQRYDFTGFGPNMTLTSNTVLKSSTPGTRLTTWANNDYCGEYVNVYYQRDGTSQVFYISFRDSYSYSSYYYSPVDSEGDNLMPLVETYGKDPNSRKKYKPAEIFGFVVAALVGWFLICCCCVAMAN
ncbi:hypothetical protein CC78DRAFT_575191 [Lojkania enalia]|uniref:Fucose-specific lectin n=1 Tax=Lojkania enalia TaxID=147567 RepID=A0A9P4TNI5_9PLEO|nr:hypothetical protein CC78DRAFT_575191 [Didymosphaeria enalia]